MTKKTWIIIAVVAVVVLWGVGKYNGLVSGEEDLKTAWGQVENQYQRRMDLIPNLVNTVKGYAKHESQTLEDVIAARAKATAITVNADDAQSLAEYQKAQGELTQAMSRLMAVSESYPDLKANENFMALQAQLEGTENRIATERKNYNDKVNSYNKSVRVFPNNLISGIFGFDVKPNFEAEDGAEKAPTVSFD